MNSDPVVPGLSARQMLPALGRIRQDTPGFLLEMAAQFGDLVRFSVPRQETFLVNRPEHIKHILQDNHRNYTKRTIQYDALAQITGRGLLTSDGDTWFRNRRLEQPAFAHARLAGLDQIVMPSVQAMLEKWKRLEKCNEQVDIDREMMQLTLEVVGKALFSIDLSSQAKPLTGAVMTALDHIVYMARNLITPPLFIPTPRNLQFKHALTILDKAVAEIIHTRRQNDETRPDLLGMLLAARDANTGQPMSERELRDEIITLLIAGHETVASSLTWTWYLLSLYPQSWQRMRQEVVQVLGERPPVCDDLAHLQYTARVYSEALRLYPPAWLITRRAIQEDHLEGGYRIPPDALIVISPYTIHRHPQYWETPLTFDPDRFTESSSASRPRFAYIPFGGGPRLCIGSGFAQVEANLILAAITQKFRLLPPGSQVKVDALVTLRPHGGLKMTLQKIGG